MNKILIALFLAGCSSEIIAQPTTQGLLCERSCNQGWVYCMSKRPKLIYSTEADICDEKNNRCKLSCPGARKLNE